MTLASKVFLYCTENEVNQRGKFGQLSHFSFCSKKESQLGFFPIWILIKFPMDEYSTIDKKTKDD